MKGGTPSSFKARGEALEASASFVHYTIVEKIGQGGMGEVFRATDSRLGRDGALKMLPAAVAAGPERLVRYGVSGDGQQFVLLRAALEDNAPQPALVVVQNWYEELRKQ